MNPTRMAVACLATAAVLALAACGGGGSSSTSTSAAPAPSTSAAPAPSSSAAPSSSSAAPSPAETSESPSPTPTPEPTEDGLSQWADSAEATSQYGEDAWSAMTATGKPKVKECGDNGEAWASLEAYGKEFLTLTYKTAVLPSRVVVYSNYNPGQITGVWIVSEDGNMTQIYAAKPTADAECPLALEIPLDGIDAPVNKVIVDVDQKKKLGLGWTEIDAVELVGTVPQ